MVSPVSPVGSGRIVYDRFVYIAEFLSIGPNRLRVPGRIVYIENLLPEEGRIVYIGINAMSTLY